MSTPLSHTNKAIQKRNILQTIKLLPMSDYGTDCYEEVETPIVSKNSMQIYEKYIKSSETIVKSMPMLESNDQNLIYKYIKMK